MAFIYDLHKVVGIVFLMPLMVIAITGSFFTFSPRYKALLRMTDTMTISSAKAQNIDNSVGIPTELIKTPSKDDYKLRAVYFPTSSTGNYRFRYISNRAIKAGLRKTKELEINQAYHVVSVNDFNHAPRSEKIAGQVYPVHIGEIIGITGRIFVFISGFIPMLLLITGYRFFRARKRMFK